MKVNALLMDEKDNVATCVEEVQAGQEITYSREGKLCTIIAGETIPYCHKIALERIEAGQMAVKYGEQIGKASEAIEQGRWVSHHNIFSIPRDYESEYIR
ncbi:MAG: UxaA family hydrolase [Lachnospiraceae bacterium]|nr:UxaA family hydrolase [Lachnospiraceae bacterium]